MSSMRSGRQVWLARSLPRRTLLSEWQRSARPPDAAKAGCCMTCLLGSEHFELWFATCLLEPDSK